MKITKKTTAILSVILVLIIAFLFIIKNDFERERGIQIGKTNYLSLTDTVYVSNHNFSASTLDLTVYILDEELNLCWLDGKERLHTIGQMQEITLTEENFDPLLTDLDWDKNFSTKEFRNNNHRAWILNSEIESKFYILFEQKNGDCLLAIGYLNTKPGNDELTSILKIHNLQTNIQNSETTIYD